MVQNWVHKNVTGKMRPVGTIPGMGGGGIIENEGGVEFNYDIYCKNFYKYSVKRTMQEVSQYLTSNYITKQ
jgi:hypothetical protein